MPEIKIELDPRQVSGYNVLHEQNSNKTIEITTPHGFRFQFKYIHNPTGNCQVSSAQNIQNVFSLLNKYKFRDLLIKIRREHFSKRILMIDINRINVEKVLRWVSPKTIVNRMDYISSNGSHMTVLLLKLSVIRQMQLPR